MGFFSSWFGKAVGAKVAYNHTVRPTIICPEGYVLKGLKPNLTGYNWTVKYSKVGSTMTTSFTISRNTTSHSIGADTFSIHWA